MAIDKEKIIADLLPLRFGKAIHSEAIERYWNYYGINFASIDSTFSQTVGIVKSDSYDLCCHIFSPANSVGTCFVAHGYFDHTGLYGHLIHKLLSLSYTVVCFDLPGHGLSSGKQADIDTFFSYEAAMQAVLESCTELPRPWHALGQSTGCSVILLSLINSPHNNIKKSVLFAPLVRPKHWYKAKVLNPIASLFTQQSPRYFSPNSHDEKFLDFIKNCDSLQSRVLPYGWVKAMREWVKWILNVDKIDAEVLVVQGQEDGTVDGEFNLKVLAQRVKSLHVRHHLSARHHLVNESAEIRTELFDDVANFLTED